MINNVYLDGVQINSEKRRLTGLENISFADVDFSSSARAGFHGEILSPSKFGKFKIGLEWGIHADSFSDLATQREEFLKEFIQLIERGGKTLKIEKDNGVDVEILVDSCTLDGNIKANSPFYNTLRVSLTSGYPFVLGTTEYSTQVNIFSGGGMAIPMSIPMSIANGGSSSVDVTNDGNAHAYPVFEFHGPIVTPTITNETTGKTISINHTLVSTSEKITVDTFYRTVVISSVGNKRELATGDFWTLQAGINKIKLTASQFNAQGYCLVKHKNHYIGI